MQGVERNRHQDSEENWAQERLNQKVAEVEHQRRQDHQNDCHRIAVAVHAVAQLPTATGRVNFLLISLSTSNHNTPKNPARPATSKSAGCMTEKRKKTRRKGP